MPSSYVGPLSNFCHHCWDSCASCAKPLDRCVGFCEYFHGIHAPALRHSRKYCEWEPSWIGLKQGIAIMHYDVYACNILYAQALETSVGLQTYLQVCQDAVDPGSILLYWALTHGVFARQSPLSSMKNLPLPAGLEILPQQSRLGPLH